MRISASTLLVTLLAIPAPVAAIKEGDKCGVTSADFLNYRFGGDYLVAGENGCTLDTADGTGEVDNCYCSPNYGDGDRLSEWNWQCGSDAVKFGPIEGKTCPVDLPVEKAPTDGATSTFSAIKPEVACDIAVNPTGLEVDPVCSYSTCDEGGDTSAICACINMTAYRIDVAEGEAEMQWFCMHSTCSCTEPEIVQEGKTISAAAQQAVGVLAIASIVAAVVGF